MAPESAVEILPPARPTRRWALLILACGLVAYANSFPGVFVFDDIHAIVENPHVRRLWPLSAALTAPPQSSVSGRPIVSLSLALNYAVSGLRPWSYHAFNLAVHLLAGLLLFGVIRRTLRSPRLAGVFDGKAAPLAAAAALCWVVHPLQTQSVTYIIQRAESLAGLCYLATLYCFIRGSTGDHRRAWYVAAVFAGATGMATKEVMVTAPLVVLLYDRAFVGGTFAAALRRRWRLYGALAATWIILAVLVATGPRSESAGFGLKEVSALDYARTQPGVILHYLRLCFWPRPLCIDYGWQLAQSPAEIYPHLAAILLLHGVSLWGLWRNHPAGFVGTAFFLILAPTSSFVPIGDFAVEHRMYLPLAAVCVLFVLALARIGVGREEYSAPCVGHPPSAIRHPPSATADKLRTSSGQAPDKLWASSVATLPDSRLPSRRAVLDGRLGWIKAGFVMAIVVTLTGLTIDRNHDYRSAVAFWTHETQVRPDRSRAHLQLGLAFKELSISESDPVVRTALLAKAADEFRTAIACKPDYADAHNSLAMILADQGRTEEAIHHYREALRARNSVAEAHHNLAVLLLNGGDIDDAVGHFEAAVGLKADFAEAHGGLGLALARKGKFDRALTHFAEAARLQPTDPDALCNLGKAYQSLGKINDAIRHYDEALRLSSGHAEARMLRDSLVGNRALTPGP